MELFLLDFLAAASADAMRRQRNCVGCPLCNYHMWYWRNVRSATTAELLPWWP